MEAIDYIRSRSVSALARALGTPRAHARRLRDGARITPAMLARLRVLDPSIVGAPAPRTPQEIVKFCASNFGPDDFEGPAPEQMERLCDFLGVPYEAVH